MNRPEPPPTGTERATLEAYLDFQRATLTAKCAGLGPVQLAQRSVSPSQLTLLGLVRHLAEVEQGWFQRRVAGLDEPTIYCERDIDGDFHLPDVVDQSTVDEAFATWQARVARSNEIVAGVTSLDETFVHERTGTQFSMRWLLVHMIEEYARHNGHADLLREAIDGVTGE